MMTSPKCWHSTGTVLWMGQASPCSSKEMWAEVVHRQHSKCECSDTQSHEQTLIMDILHCQSLQGQASTRASAKTVDVQVKHRPVHAPAIVGGVWMHHKVTKTGHAAVPSAAFEQSPASGCGPPDACRITPKLSRRSKGKCCARAAVQPTPALPRLVVKTM
ncbi:hypothetical protein MTO96_036271 [Rhipicephalus appendiculatus]